MKIQNNTSSEVMNRKNRLQGFILIFVSLTLTVGIISCGTLYKRFFPKKEFTAKSQRGFFIHTPNNIREQIDIDGFFRCDSDYYSWYATKNLLLFDDNSFGYFLFANRRQGVDTQGKSYSYITSEEDCSNPLDSLDLDDNMGKLVFCEGSRKYWNTNGGAYLIEDGRIVMEHPVVFNDERVICRNIFKIIDRRTLQRDTFQIITDDSIIRIDTAATFHFVRAYNLPNPSFIKEKKYKWMWKNKEDWKLHKVQRKKDIQKFKEEHRPQNLQR